MPREYLSQKEPLLRYLISFSDIIAPACTLSTISKGSRDSGYPCVVLDLVIQYQMISPEYIHANNKIENSQAVCVSDINTYIIYAHIYVYNNI